jgi:hypothetical protein
MTPVPVAVVANSSSVTDNNLLSAAETSCSFSKDAKSLSHLSHLLQMYHLYQHVKCFECALFYGADSEHFAPFYFSNVSSVLRFMEQIASILLHFIFGVAGLMLTRVGGVVTVE